MQLTPDLVIAILLFGVWAFLLINPRWFVVALFVTSPWAGLYATPGWEIDAFKPGLILSPLLLLRIYRPSPLRDIRWPITLMILYAGALALWAVIVKEPLQFDSISTVQYEPRVIVQYLVFVFRALLPFVITSVALRRSDATAWMNSYVWSIFVLCCYGIVQECTFVLLDTSLTPIFRNGIFGGISEVATVNISGDSFLRVHSFSREPKDLALFCVPALAWLFARIATPEAERVRGTALDRVRFVVIAVCAVLTFASSLLIVIPLLILGIECVRPRFKFTGNVRYWIRSAAVVSVIAPLLWIAAESRVIQRFTDTSGSFDVSRLIQPSREGPALDFLAQAWPRSLLGFGIGTQAFYLPRYMPHEFSKKVYEYESAAGVDSLVVAVVADLGAPGLVLLFAVLWCALRRRRSHNPQWALRAALIATALMSIPLNPSQQGSILWLLLGVQALEKARPDSPLERRSSEAVHGELVLG